MNFPYAAVKLIAEWLRDRSSHTFVEVFKAVSEIICWLAGNCPGPVPPQAVLVGPDADLAVKFEALADEKAVKAIDWKALAKMILELLLKLLG